MDPIEDYKSPFSFEEGLNTNYLYLSPKESFSPLSSPALPCRGNLCAVTHVQLTDCDPDVVIGDTGKYTCVFQLHIIKKWLALKMHT